MNRRYVKRSSQGVTRGRLLLLVAMLAILSASVVLILNQFSKALVLNPVITGDEPHMLTYSMPLSVDVSSNGCYLTLMDNGEQALACGFHLQTNGTYLVRWNTDSTTNGPHILQVVLERPHRKSVYGPKRKEYVHNIARFDSDNCFLGKVWISAALIVSSANYRIDLCDTNNNLLRTIVGHTDKGVIDEYWDLKTTDGQIRDDHGFNSTVYIWPNAASGNTSNLMSSNALSGSEQYHRFLCRFGKGGDGSSTGHYADTNMVNMPFLFQPTSAHEEAALKVMLAEANLYAERLHLPENIPITKTALQGIHISPPEFANRSGAMGSLQTTNYSYAFGRGKRLAYITRLPKDKSGRPLYDRFKPWAIDPSAVNTNAAYLLATQFLAAAYVDLPRLSKLTVSVHPIKILDMTTSVYRLEWIQGDRAVVEVGLDEPTRELWLLRVEDPQYILRKPLEVPKP